MPPDRSNFIVSGAGLSMVTNVRRHAKEYMQNRIVSTYDWSPPAADKQIGFDSYSMDVKEVNLDR